MKYNYGKWVREKRVKEFTEKGQPEEEKQGKKQRKKCTVSADNDFFMK